MKSTFCFLVVLALPACSGPQSPSPSKASSVEDRGASSLGQIVTDIDHRIWCIHQDRNGDHWFGSNGNGVYRYDGHRVIQYRRVDGLAGNQIRDIEEDSKGNIFISANGGITKFDGKEFTSLAIVETHIDGGGWSLDPNDVWIVLEPGSYGPMRFDGKVLHHMKLPHSPAEDEFRAKYPDATYSPSGVYSIYKDRRGHLWFGTSSIGIFRYDGQGLSWMYEERLTTTPSGGAFGIRSIYEDRAGDFWICNTRQRFKILSEVKIEGGISLVQYDKLAGLPRSISDDDKNFTYSYSMVEDSAGALWMACGSDGVLKFDGKEVTHYSVREGSCSMSIYRDRAGKLWLGTIEHGLFVLDGERFEPFVVSGPSK